SNATEKILVRGARPSRPRAVTTKGATAAVAEVHRAKSRLPRKRSITSSLLRHPSHHPRSRCRTHPVPFQITSGGHEHGGFAGFSRRCRSSGSLAVRRVTGVSTIHSGWLILTRRMEAVDIPAQRQSIDARFIGLRCASAGTSGVAYCQEWQDSGNGATICHDISQVQCIRSRQRHHSNRKSVD
ncbi:hypothetical protein LTR98_011873, partial [Exophiala xenobiotica]